MRSFFFITTLFTLIFTLADNVSFSQVNLQTGTSQINIPLYSVADVNNDLSTIVSLNYVGGAGIKVNDVASSVGTGWDLSFGGSITRIQHGEPDDQKQRTQYQSGWTTPHFFPWSSFDSELDQPTQSQINAHVNYVNNYYPNGYLYSEYSPTDVIGNSASYSYRSKRPILDLPHPKFLADREHDIFQFSFNGRTGQFIIGKDAGNTILYLNQGDSKLKAEIVYDQSLINQNIRTTIKGFKITDEKGIQYVFEDMELSEVIKYDKIYEYTKEGAPYPGPGVGWQQTKYQLSDYYNSGPDLYPVSNSNAVYTKGINGQAIFNPLIHVVKGRKLNQFICNRWMLTNIINPLTSKSIDFYYENVSLTLEKDHSTSIGYMDGENASYSVNINLSSEKLKKISRITNQYGEEVVFNYNDSRKDLEGDEVLNEVCYYKDNNLLSKHSFKYGYFYKNSIREFDYNFPSKDLPYARLCLNEVKKTGSNNLSENPFKIEYYLGDNYGIVPPKFALYTDHWGYLNAITNEQMPYGNNIFASSTYLYTYLWPGGLLQHKLPYSYNGIGMICGLVKSVTYPLGSKLAYEYENNTAFYDGSDITTGGQRVKSVTQFSEENVLDKKLIYKYVLDNGKSSGWGYEPPIYDIATIIRTLTCNEGDEKERKFINAAVKQAAELINTAVGGGILTKYIIQNLLTGYIQIIMDIFWPPHPPLYVENNQVSQFSGGPINYGNPLPQFYSRVEVETEKSSVTLLKDIFTYTSNTDFPILVPVYEKPYALKQRYGYWKYGLLKRAEHKNGNNDLVKIEEYKYDTMPPQQQTHQTYFASQKWMVIIDKVECFPHYAVDGSAADIYNNGSAGANILREIYYPYCGSVFLSESTEYLYNTSGNSTTNTTYFQYNSDYILKKKTQSNSKGQIIETEYKYSNDYTITGALATLKTNNNISAPVLTETFITKGGVKKLLSGSITEYGVLTNNDIKPIKTYEFRSSEPVDNSTITVFNQNQLVRDGNYYKQTGEIIYYADGSLAQANKMEEYPGPVNKVTERSAFITDINSPSLVLATATNANRSDIAYTSFETPPNISNWNYNAGLVYKDDKITGDNCFLFDEGLRSVSKQSLNPGIKYKLTFWAKTLPRE